MTRPGTERRLAIPDALPSGPDGRGQVPQEDDPVGAVVDGRLDYPVVFDAERRDVDPLANGEPHPAGTFYLQHC